MALKRSTSANSIFIPVSYVTSSQLSLRTYCGRLMMDRYSQTPHEWEEMDKQKFERKINDHFDIIKDTQGKQHVNVSQVKNKESHLINRNNETHNRISSSPTSSSSSLNASPQLTPKHGTLINAAVSTTTKSGPIAIPNKLALEISNYRAGNSVEELNQEIENLVLKGISVNNSVGHRIPEGHRAPILEMLCQRRTKTAKTQTLNCNIIDYNHEHQHQHQHQHQHEHEHEHERDETNEIKYFITDGIDENCPSCDDNSRSESPNSPLLSRSSSTDPVTLNESNQVDLSSSPKINKFLTREPPDGCEKVKTLNEDSRRFNSNLSLTLLATRPLKPSDGFVLLPSRSSAFLPIPNSNYINSVLAMNNFKNEINKFK